MSLCRETASLTVPWEVAESRLRGWYGRPTRDGDAYYWSAGRVGPYDLGVEADRSAGRITADVSTPLPYRGLVAAVALCFAAAAIRAPPPVVFLGLEFVCLGLAFLPVAPTLPAFDLVGVRLPDGIAVERRALTPAGLVPVAGVFAAQWHLLASPPALAVVALAGVLSIAVYAFRAGVGSAPLKRQAYLVLLPGAAALPLLLGAWNLVSLSTFAADVPPAWIPPLLAGLVVNTAVVMVAYGFACVRALEAVPRLPNAAVDSDGLRIAWGGCLLLSNLGLVALTGLLVGGASLPRFDPGVGEVPVAVLVAGLKSTGAPAPRVVVGLVLSFLVLPLLVVALFWVHHLIRTLRTPRRALDASRPLDGVDSEVEVRVLDSAATVAHPITTFAGREAVVVSSRVVDELADEELAAVVAHETYHLLHSDLRRNALASVLGVAIGGRNALVALYNYPEIERRADLFAAEKTDPGAVIRALRRLDGLNAGASASRSGARPRRSNSNARSDGKGWRFRVRRLATAPYHLLFGSIVLENAHADVDDRIGYLLDRDDRADEGERSLRA